MFKFIIYFSIIFVLSGCSSASNQSQTEEPVTTESDNQMTEENLKNTGYRFINHTEYLDEAEVIEEDIKTQWSDQAYTVESPLIMVNPYEINPLSALVLFETDTPVKITYTVEGKTDETDISNSIEEFNTVHELPILGLYPGFENNINLQLENENGDINNHQIQIETEEIPNSFYDLNLIESQPQNMALGITFLNSSGGEYFAVDSLGDIRFILKPWMANNVEHLDNGHILIVLRRETNENDALGVTYDHVLEIDLLGKPYNSYIFEMDNYDGPVPFDHDIIELSNENILALVHDSQSKSLEDVLIEFDRETGDVLKVTDFKDLFPNEYYEGFEFEGEPSYDWLHHNAVDQTEDGESILLSHRNQDMIMKLKYPENEIEWILTADENWPGDNTRPDDYLLTPINDVKFQMGQHAVEEMPDQDGNEDTIDIMLFDNNRYITRGQEEHDGKYSRAAQYRINEEDMTVEEIWSYGEERGESSYSDIVSDADYLEKTNNVLINFGRTYDENNDIVSQIVEVDKDTNEVVFEYHVTQTPESDRRQIYRADRLPLYPDDFEFNSILKD